MKVQAIKNYTPAVNNKTTQNNRKSHISFGFGDDYGNDDFLYDSDHKSDGNLFEYISLAISFPFVWISEVIKEKRAAKKFRDDLKSGKTREYDPNEFN